jgi:hypothetical protein
MLNFDGNLVTSDWKKDDSPEAGLPRWPTVGAESV